MNIKNWVAALAAAAIISGCNGGAPTPPSFYTGTPGPVVTSAPTSKHILFSWSGGAHSTKPSSLARAIQEISGTEDIAIGAPNNPNDPQDNAIRYGMTEASIKATEVDASGSPVPNANPTYGTTDQSVVKYAPQPVASGTPAPQVVGVNVGSAGTSVSFPDGANGTVKTNVYQTLHLSCPSATGGTNQPSGYTYSPTSGSIVSSLDTTADLYLTGPRCPGAYANNSNAVTVVAQYGYQSLPTSTPFGSVASGIGFIPSGTSVTFPTSSFNNPLWLVKSGTPGVYLKVRFVSNNCSGNACEFGIELDADALASNSVGVFPF